MPLLRSARFAVAIPLLVAALALPGIAHAQLVSSPAWGAGLGVSLKRQAYTGIDTDTTVIPLLSYENRWVRFAGPVLDLKLPVSGPVALGLRARYAFEDGYEAGDAPVLAGMAERKPGLWLGATALWRNGVADLSAEWLADASGRSGGQRLRLMGERSFRQGAFELTPRLALHWHDSRSVNYYYGVRSQEASAGRPRYAGRSVINTELGLRTSYALTASQGLYLDLSATRLGSGIQDSPLVDRNAETAVRFGYLYRF